MIKIYIDYGNDYLLLFTTTDDVSFSKGVINSFPAIYTHI